MNVLSAAVLTALLTAAGPEHGAGGPAAPAMAPAAAAPAEDSTRLRRFLCWRAAHVPECTLIALTELTHASTLRSSTRGFEHRSESYRMAAWEGGLAWESGLLLRLSDDIALGGGVQIGALGGEVGSVRATVRTRWQVSPVVAVDGSAGAIRAHPGDWNSYAGARADRPSTGATASVRVAAGVAAIGLRYDDAAWPDYQLAGERVWRTDGRARALSLELGVTQHVATLGAAMVGTGVAFMIFVLTRSPCMSCRPPAHR